MTQLNLGSGFDALNTTTNTDSDYPAVPNTGTSDHWKIDMAQIQYFTMRVSGMDNTLFHKEKYGDFFPVESVSDGYAPLENMSVSSGVFRELVFTTGKKLLKYNVTMYDTSDGFYEKKLREWHATTVVKDMYVAYLDEMTRQITINAFDTTGVLIDSRRLTAILMDEIQVPRNVSESALKKISFSLAIVG